VALVTGAGRGIGRSVAVALAEAGAEVWLIARTASEIEQAAAEIRAAGGRANACACDVTDAAALKRTFAALPALDVMVNNAGANIPEPFVDVSEEHLDRLLGLNVRAAFLAAQAAARKMLEAPDRKQRGGAIINVSSQMGHVGAPNRSVYCLSKHALEGLTKAMSVELAPHNIRVNSVAPSYIYEDVNKGYFDWLASEAGVTHDDIYAEKAQPTDLKRLASPAEVARAVDTGPEVPGLKPRWKARRPAPASAD